MAQWENAALIANLKTRFVPNDIVFRDWTPTITQSGSVTCTVTYARYILIGQVAIVEAMLAMTGAGTGGNAIVIGGQPSVIQHAYTNANVAIIGSAIVLDTGTAHYHGALISVGATDWRIISDGQAGYVGAAPNFALASSDAIGFRATFERA